MWNRFVMFFVSLILPALCFATELPDEYFSEGLEETRIKWLQVDLEKNEGVDYIDYSTIFRGGLQFALEAIWKENNWQKHKVINFDYDEKRGDSVVFPIIVRKYQIHQAPYSDADYCSSCYVFVSKGGDLNQTLILEISSSHISIQQRSGRSTDPDGIEGRLAKEFRGELIQKIKTGLVYKNAVLEYYGDVHFLKGVDDYSFDWESFIYPSDIKAQIQKTIEEFINEYDEEIFRHYGLPMSRGVLLYGPPGTGKSFIAKIIASRILNNRYKKEITYLHVSAHNIYSVESVRALYQVARDLSPSVVFIEDIDLIAGTDRTDLADVKNELMQQLSGLEELRGVLTIGTTNVAERIDPALKRSKRLGFQFEIALPRLVERQDLFRIYLSSSDLDATVDLNYWASVTEGLSGADIKELCDIAIEIALNAGNLDKKTMRVRIGAQDLELAKAEKSRRHNKMEGVLQ